MRTSRKRGLQIWMLLYLKASLARGSHGVAWRRAADMRLGRLSRPCVQGVFALFVEFVLEFEALVVGLCGANGFDGGSDPIVHVPLAEFTRGDLTITGAMIRTP